MSGVSFGEVRLEISEAKSWNVRVDYGGVRGSETFKNVTEALIQLDRWSDDEVSRLAKELAGLAKLRRWIRRNRRTA